MNRLLPLALLLPLAAALPLAAQETAPPVAAAAPAEPTFYDFEIVARYPHDPDAYTQGLLWHDGALYESTGREGQSEIRRVDLATGEIEARRAIPPGEFGEGLALWNDTLVSLTWMDGTVHRWDRETLAPLSSDAYNYEGWGLTTDGESLIASDGSPTLRFLDPETGTLRRKIDVTIRGTPLGRLNELEMMDGRVFANVWHTGFIVGIDPGTGVVDRVLDLRPLAEANPNADREGVLNGIAYDPAGDRLFVTGKLWSNLYEIRVTPRPSP
ncbi:glutaminyl-peptide cyclotransferase [Aurantiacibacter spongiae]|uniref:Glutaminyl-peptide cyclotransferase n=1 Tax=Aurantiacibacter spongiae TaxID=2488860 RepID=A0A3N5CT39_9SPHN|nr:glutaminyl-peptide cyclotransferase [Aurantiacibacter spongiae]RPF72344.1 glutaminyl-peptide cyclotransferase [Aurantiacibacter spongiae]